MATLSNIYTISMKQSHLKKIPLVVSGSIGGIDTYNNLQKLATVIACTAAMLTSKWLILHGCVCYNFETCLPRHCNRLLVSTQNRNICAAFEWKSRIWSIRLSKIESKIIKVSCVRRNCWKSVRQTYFWSISFVLNKWLSILVHIYIFVCMYECVHTCIYV